MAYTTPRTWATGETVTAAMMNAQVSANTAYVYDMARTKTVILEAFNYTESVQRGDGAQKFFVPAVLNNGVVNSVHAAVATAGTAGTIIMQVARDRGGTIVDVLSTRASIDANEQSSYTGGTAVVNATYETLQTGDWLRVDVDDAGGGTVTANAGAKGLFAIITVKIP